MDSAAKGLNDLIKMTVSRIGLHVLVRRDNWISHFTTSPSIDAKHKLREASLNEDGLFGSKLLTEVLKTVKEDKHDEVQDAFLQKMDVVAPRSDYSGKSNRSFRQSGGNRRKSNSADWSTGGANQPRRHFGNKGGNRGGRGRGSSGGGGRGARGGGRGAGRGGAQ